MNNLSAEQQAVLAAFEAMQQAMIDKDIEKMTALVAPDKTFTHMSGRRQTKEQYFGEIRNGILNYYRYQIRNLNIEVNGERAVLKADVALTARVYGMSGTWTVPVRTNYRKESGKWIQCS